MKTIHARSAIVAAVACSLAAAQLPAIVIADEPEASDGASTTRSLGAWRDTLASADAASAEWPDWTDSAYLPALKEKAEAAGEELRAAGQEIVEAGREYFEDLFSKTGEGEDFGDAGNPDVPVISESADGAAADGSGPVAGVDAPSGGSSGAADGEGSLDNSDASGASATPEASGPTGAVPGDADQAPTEAVAAVEVPPGTASIAVNSQSVAYGEAVEAVVTAGPGDAKPVTVIVGVDTSGQPFVGADFPDVTIGDLMGEGDPILDGITLQGLMVLLIGPDFSLEAIESNLGTIGQMLALAGVENADELVEGLRTVIDVARDISPDLLDVSVKLGATPTEAGLYTVIAFTANKNYEPAFDVGYIAIKQRYEDITLEFARPMDDGARLTVDDAAAFDYGVAVRDADGAPIDAAKVVVSFDGIAYDGMLYHSSEAPSKPGSYSQTAYILGGNYYASPIARSYVVERYDAALTIDGAVDGTVTVEYNGAPQGVSVTLTFGDGAVIENAQVELAYYRGMTENGDLYISATPPTDVGTYRVTAAYAGDDRYGPAAACAELVIEKADARIDVTGVCHTTYGDPVDHAAMAAGFSIDAHGAPIPDEALAVLRDYLVCPCGGDEPHAGAYTVELESGFSTDRDSLFKQIVIDSGNFAGVDVVVECEHVVDPRPLTLMVDDAVKTAGDADPVFAYTLVDGDGVVLPDAAELLTELGDVDIAREEGELPGVYAMTAATCENSDYALMLYGTPVLKVEARSAAPVSPEIPQVPALPSAPVRPSIPQTADGLGGGTFAAGAFAVTGAGAVLASLVTFARRLGR